jgi:hypothetical protein
MAGEAEDMASKAGGMVLDRSRLRDRIASLEAELASLKAMTAPARPQVAPWPKPRHRQKGRLTNRRIETLKVPGFYADGDNLYLDFKEHEGRPRAPGAAIGAGD